MGTALDSTKFSAGDRVTVASGHAFAGPEVAVVHYWRNGYFIVREDRFQTTVAADADKLTMVYPRTVDGRTTWACCESQIGPKCQHLV